MTSAPVGPLSQKFFLPALNFLKTVIVSTRKKPFTPMTAIIGLLFYPSSSDISMSSRWANGSMTRGLPPVKHLAAFTPDIHHFMAPQTIGTYHCLQAQPWDRHSIMGQTRNHGTDTQSWPWLHGTGTEPRDRH